MTSHISDVKNQAPSVKAQALNLFLKGPNGPVHILKDVDLQIEPGEIISIVGPSGSGKTSLLMVIAGLEPATSGLVEVAGTNLKGMDEDELALFRRENIGIVFQNFHLIPTMSALENVALPLEFSGPLEFPGSGDAFEQARLLLGQVGLTERMDHYPSQLSGGEQQRVGLARAMVSQAKLLLADEPTGNLDGQTSLQIKELLFDMARSHGSSLILITHDEKLARQCDRQLVMSEGKLK